MDITERKPLLFSNKALIAMLIPLILDGLLAIAAGFVDSIMVASSGESAVSAVALVDRVNLLFIALLRAVGVGGSVITSQYIGNKNLSGARNSATQLVVSSGFIAAVFSLLVLSLVPVLISTLYGQIEQDVYIQAKTYLYLTAIQYPFLAVASSCSSLLRTMGKNNTTLILLSAMNVVNVVFNAIFINGLKMGVAGAAVATTLCRIFWCVCSLIILSRKSLPVYLESLRRFRPDFSMIRRVLRVGMANGVESMLFQLGMLLISGLVSTFGTAAISANSVAGTLNDFGCTVMGAFSTALLIVVGRCVGADAPEQARYYIRKLSGWGHITSFAIFGLIFLLRQPLVQLFHFGPEATEIAILHTGIASVCCFVCIYPWAYVYPSAFRAAGDIKYPLLLGTISMFVFRVGLSYLLANVFCLGLLSLRIGILADSLFRSVINKIHYHRGKWLKEKMI